MVFLGQDPTPGPPPLFRGNGERALPFDAQLVQVERPSEPAVGEVDVGEHQMGCVHPAQRDDPHGVAGSTSQNAFVHLSHTGDDEAVGLRNDAEGVGDDGVREVHGGVPQMQRGRCRPARPMALQMSRGKSDGHCGAEHRPGQFHSACTRQRP